MRSHLRRIVAVGILVACVSGLQGCGFVYSLMAKNRLNEGVRTFNKGKYEESEKMFEEALELDPSNVNAKLFYAMAVNASFEKSLNSQDVDKSGTIALADKTIKAFQDVLDANPEKFQIRDQATAFIAKTHKSLRDTVYDPVKEEAKYAAERNAYLDTIKKRAEMPEQTARVKAQMYYTYADDYWREANAYTNAQKKPGPMNPDGTFSYIPPTPERRAIIMAAINKSHEYMQKAIAADPTYPEPYLGEKLLTLEEIYISDDEAQKTELNKKKLEWDEKYREKVATQAEADADAAAAAPAAAPAAEGGK